MEEYIDPQLTASPFRPSWLYGYNSKVPVHCLYTLREHLLAFAGAHHVVIMDVKKAEQEVLQGHRNNVTCLAKSHNGAYLASGDSGVETSSVFVWSVTSRKPVVRLSNPHGAPGVEAVEFTAADRWLVTVGGSSSHQSVCLWDWKDGPEGPLACVPMKPGKVWAQVASHPTLPNQFLVGSKTSVTFFQFEQSSGELASHCHGSVEKEFGKSCGHITQSVYLRHSRQVLSATTRGNLVVWLPPAQEGGGGLRWKPTRLLRLEEENLGCLVERDGYIAIASHGTIAFYNEELQRVKWTQNFGLGKVLSISHRIEDETFERKGPEIVLSDFVVSLEGPLAGYVSFATGNLNTLINGKGAPWTFQDIHPTKNQLLLGNILGFVSIYNYLSNERIGDKDLNIEDEIMVVKYSPAGDLLAVGTKKGQLWLLQEATMEPVRSQPFSYSKGSIKHLAWSDCGQMVATGDTDRCVSVYSQNRLLGTPWQWELLGRYRAHSRPLLQLLFGRDPDTGKKLLLSLGKDLRLCQFDIDGSSVAAGLILLQRSEVEQRCLPTCMAWLPQSKEQETFLVVATKHQKQRLLNITTKMCRKVVSCPRELGHVSAMHVVQGLQGLSPLKTTEGYFLLVCGTHIALQKLPLTGCPHHHLATLANPRGVGQALLAPTGKQAFTMSREDDSFQQWDINPLVLEDFVGEVGGNPWLTLLPGGSESQVYKDLQDFFCYVQVERGVTELRNKVPLEDVATLCRALGFFPTEKEIEDMVNETKYSGYVTSGQLETQIALQEFLHLFLNHRPAKGEDTVQLEKVFKVMGSEQVEEPGHVPTVTRDQFVNFLKNHGEFFKDRDFQQFVKPLFSSGADTAEEEESHNEFHHIPEELTYRDFVTGALKLPEVVACRGELPRVAASARIELVLDQDEPPIKA